MVAYVEEGGVVGVVATQANPTGGLDRIVQPNRLPMELHLRRYQYGSECLHHRHRHPSQSVLASVDV